MSGNAVRNICLWEKNVDRSKDIKNLIELRINLDQNVINEVKSKFPD